MELQVFGCHRCSGCNLRFWQKCVHTAFVLENFKPFSLAHFSILLRFVCSWRSITDILMNIHEMEKSSTNRDLSIPGLMAFTILFIFNINSVTDRIQQWGTPISCECISESKEPNLTLKTQLKRKLLRKIGIWPFKPILCKSFRMPNFHVVS